MKRLILSISAIITMAFSSYAQCTPDPQFTQGGIYPDSATGLAPAYVGVAYTEIVTVVVPADTLVGGSVVPIVDITLNSITGFPPNFGYVSSPSNGVFPGGTNGCLNISSSVNPTIADIGVYPLTITVTPTVSVFGFPVAQPATTLDYYFIEILSSVGIGQFNDESFELKTIYPNPVENNSKIQFITGVSSEVSFTVSNLLGEVLLSKEISAKRGVNDIYISADDFANGIYLYSISSNGNTSTKRMIISK